MSRNIKGEDSSLLEQTVTQAIHGVPELKIDERRRYLGTFKERVIAVLTEEEYKKNKGLNVQIKEAMLDDQAYVILVKGIFIKQLGDYIELAQKLKIKFKVVSRPDLTGDNILVVASKKIYKKR